MPFDVLSDEEFQEQERYRIAIKVMVGFASNPVPPDGFSDMLAAKAYEYADAIVKERPKWRAPVKAPDDVVRRITLANRIRFHGGLGTELENEIIGYLLEGTRNVIWNLCGAENPNDDGETCDLPEGHLGPHHFFP